jgi:hypothetical protein
MTSIACATLFAAGHAGAPLLAQANGDDTRAAVLEREAAQKALQLQPPTPNKAEKYVDYAENWLTAGGSQVHPFFDSAYSGGGFTVGAGYRWFVKDYNTLDIRGSVTPSGYKRFESEFIAPRLLQRRAQFSFIGGWREATQVGFYGLGTSTTKDDRTNYGFKQPYGAADFRVRPRRGLLVVSAAVETSQWQQTPGSGDAPSVETVYVPETLSGLGAAVTYLHSQAGVAIDSRSSPGYARRGGVYGITFHDFNDADGQYGFKRIDYEAIQHVPLMRDAWVASFRAAVSTTGMKSGEQIPFFMLPAVGGGSSLRGYSSWRFRDRNSLELQSEWRVMVNRYVDLALFYDAGKVTAHTRDLTLDSLKHDYGVGVRFHGPLATPLRVEFARGNEGVALVFAASAAF